MGSEILAAIASKWPDYKPDGCGLLTLAIFGCTASI